MKNALWFLLLACAMICYAQAPFGKSDIVKWKLASDVDPKTSGTATLEEAGSYTNYVSKVLTNNVAGYTNGLLVITKVYDGTTNTYYDLTD